MENEFIIVAEDKTEKEAGQTLKNLIGEQGKFSAVLWDVKHYKAEEPGMKSTQKILFIGRNEVANRNLASINWKFEDLNMRYGWVGSVAMLQIVDQKLTENEVTTFWGLCEKQKEYIQGVEKEKERKSSASETVLGLLLLPVLPISIPLLLLNSSEEKAKFVSQEYQFLVREFFLKGLDAFMGGSGGERA